MIRARPFFFFFQAEDGIRDPLVTGVQTCALPISRPDWRAPSGGPALANPGVFTNYAVGRARSRPNAPVFPAYDLSTQVGRSEKRRVGKECRSRWSAYH